MVVNELERFHCSLAVDLRKFEPILPKQNKKGAFFRYPQVLFDQKAIHAIGFTVNRSF